MAFDAKLIFVLDMKYLTFPESKIFLIWFFVKSNPLINANVSIQKQFCKEMNMLIIT